MTRNQRGMAVFAAVAVIGLSAAVFSGDLSLPSMFSTSPQAMCSSKDVERTLHQEWVDMLSKTTFSSVLGIPEDAALGLTEADIAEDFAFKEASFQYRKAQSPSSPNHAKMHELYQEMQRIRQRLIDEYKAKHPSPPTPPTEVNFVSEPVAVEFDPNVKRVTCVRQLTTNNQIISFALAADGQDAVTTRYSVQPATDGGYIVSILNAP
jgi:hypothetical protein